jgi:hypothetical protein
MLSDSNDSFFRRSTSSRTLSYGDSFSYGDSLLNP